MPFIFGEFFYWILWFQCRLIYICFGQYSIGNNNKRSLSWKFIHLRWLKYCQSVSNKQRTQHQRGNIPRNGIDIGQWDENTKLRKTKQSDRTNDDSIFAITNTTISNKRKLKYKTTTTSKWKCEFEFRKWQRKYIYLCFVNDIEYEIKPTTKYKQKKMNIIWISIPKYTLHSNVFCDSLLSTYALVIGWAVAVWYLFLYIVYVIYVYVYKDYIEIACFCVCFIIDQSFVLYYNGPYMVQFHHAKNAKGIILG